MLRISVRLLLEEKLSEGLMRLAVADGVLMKKQLGKTDTSCPIPHLLVYVYHFLLPEKALVLFIIFV